jgi:hypothetical protein
MEEKKKKVVGRPIKKGEVRNPLGGRAHNPELKKLRKLTREELVKVGSLVLKEDIRALEIIQKSRTEPVLKKWFASVALRALTTGESQHFNILLDRVVGKSKDEIKMEATVTTRQKYKEMSTEELIKEATAKAAEVKKLAETPEDNGNGSN